MLGRTRGTAVASSVGALLVAAVGVVALWSGSQPAGAAVGGLPDLGMAQLSNLRVDKLSDGRRVLRFSSVIVNVGAGAFELHGSRASGADSTMSVVQRVYDGQGGYSDTGSPAAMVFGGDGHSHWHVRDLESSELDRLDNGTKVGTGGKLGFCFFDNTAYRTTLSGAPQSPVYTGCGDTTSLQVTMGLSIGWGDLYKYTLPDQFIDITGLSAGRYRLLVTADRQGWFAESNESTTAPGSTCS